MACTRAAWRRLQHGCQIIAGNVGTDVVECQRGSILKLSMGMNHCRMTRGSFQSKDSFFRVFAVAPGVRRRNVQEEV